MKYSIVIPVYNEAGSIQPLYFSLKETMGAMSESYEVIFINDFSEDESLLELGKVVADSSNITIVNLKHRLGQSGALQAGFDIAKGEIIITLDGDLQNNPKDIPKLLKKMEEGYDLVCGYRYPRKDPAIKRWTSKIAVFLRNIITREKTHDPGCALRVFKRAILRDVYLTKSLHRFFTLLIKKLGYRIAEVKVSHSYRRFGKSHYSTKNRFFESLFIFGKLLLLGVPDPRLNKPGIRIGSVIKK